MTYLTSFFAYLAPVKEWIKSHPYIAGGIGLFIAGVIFGVMW